MNPCKWCKYSAYCLPDQGTFLRTLVDLLNKQTASVTAEHTYARIYDKLCIALEKKLWDTLPNRCPLATDHVQILRAVHDSDLHVKVEFIKNESMRKV